MLRGVLLFSVAMASVACGEDGSRGSSGDSAGGGGDGGSGGDGGGALPQLSVDRTGTFQDGALQLIIEIHTRSCSGDCPGGASKGAVIDNDGIEIQLEDADFNDIAITNVSVTADGQDVPMAQNGSSWEAQYAGAQPIAERYAFTIDAGAGNRISNLVYETSILPPHSIDTPANGSTLIVGQDVTVQWTPNDPRLWFQVDLSNQPYDATYTGGDPGTFTLPGSAITVPQPDDQLRVGRRAILTIEGMPQSGVRHTHNAAIDVIVADK